MCIEIYTGLKFGKLTVIGINEEKTKINRSKSSNSSGDNIYNVKCDCGKTTTIRSSHIRRAINENRDSTCGMCYTFEDWCLDNNHQDYLDLWDYELNDKKPSEISYGTDKKFYFKCERDLHNSDSYIICNITVRGYKQGCYGCNSIGQYLLDTYKSLDMWSKKNTFDPFVLPCKGIQKILLICEHCGRTNEISGNTFCSKKYLPCACGDNVSYPNKFITSVLDQLNISFKTEHSFKYGTKHKRYDHYIQNLNCLIENHGIQHYEQSRRGRTLEEEQLNDKFKRELALNNGVEHYIVLDCRKSELNWIKNSVMNSELPKILNFKEEDIDWFECEKYALKNLVKEVCSLWNSGKFQCSTDLAKILKISGSSVNNYLNKGTELGWCNYDKEKVEKARIEKSVKLRSKRVEVFKSGVSLGIFDSVTILSRESKELFGETFTNSGVSAVCRNKLSLYKGYAFKYINS